MKYYYYISGSMGMTSSGSFSKDQNRWIKFDQNDVDVIGNNRPYGSSKPGAFILVTKFKV